MRFILEARRKDGKSYPPNTLHQLICGILRYVRQIKPQIDFFKDKEFAGMRRTLDAEMKSLRAEGLGTTPKQAEPLTPQDEEKLWAAGVLGDHNPQALVDTMVFMCGLYFAMRSGQEHRRLRIDQIRLIEPPNESAFLVYTENVSKNNPGGLHHRKLKAKEVNHYENKGDPRRCFVRLFKCYVSHRPQGSIKDNAFYLTPVRNPKTSVWYMRSAIGHNTLNTIVQRLCKLVGIPGFKTNHSLRVTAATRLFQNGVDEQLIMARTGHRSTDGIRAYKRISGDQQKSLSEVLNLEKTNPEPNIAQIGQPSAPKKPKMDGATAQHSSLLGEKENLVSGRPVLNFSGCSGNITIQFGSQC